MRKKKYITQEAGTRSPTTRRLNNASTLQNTEIFSAYVGAKAHLNKIRTSRGFYPVAAMVQGPQAPRPSHRPQDIGKAKGRSKEKKVKGKGKSSGGGKGSAVRQCGRDALGSVICLRCGTAGSLAKNCRREGSGGEEDASVMMAENFNMSEDVYDTDSDDIAVQDQGAASVLGSKRPQVPHGARSGLGE